MSDVLDKQAITRLRTEYLKVLDNLGVIDPSRTDAAVYNGAPLDGYPIFPSATTIRRISALFGSSQSAAQHRA